MTSYPFKMATPRTGNKTNPAQQKIAPKHGLCLKDKQNKRAKMEGKETMKWDASALKVSLMIKDRNQMSILAGGQTLLRKMCSSPCWPTWNGFIWRFSQGLATVFCSLKYIHSYLDINRRNTNKFG